MIGAVDQVWPNGQASGDDSLGTLLFMDDMKIAVEVVGEWHIALNSGDVDRLVALSSDDVEIVGPRGSGHGSQLLRDWVARSGIRLELRRIYVRDSIIVAEELAEWRSPDTDEVVDHQELATIFHIEDSRVTYIDRRPSLDDALQLTGFGESDLRST